MVVSEAAEAECSQRKEFPALEFTSRMARVGRLLRNRFFASCPRVKSLQSCLTLCNAVDLCSPDSSVHGILQARKLAWAAVSSSMDSSRPRDRTHVSYVFSSGSRLLPLAPLGKPPLLFLLSWRPPNIQAFVGRKVSE